MKNYKEISTTCSAYDEQTQKDCKYFEELAISEMFPTQESIKFYHTYYDVYCTHRGKNNECYHREGEIR